MIDEQELKKKLAERAGFKLANIKWDFHYEWNKRVPDWLYPDTPPYTKRDLPNFPESLDACFKWLVPERILEITFMYASNCVSCDIEDLDSNFFEGHVNTESIEEAWTKSALALCLAIGKLIDKERLNE